MRYVLLTSDYEIFGNGTGDVRQHMVDPTERMARLCEKHGMPLTLFVEMEETLAFERYASDLQRSFGYDPYQLVRNQIVDLVRRGHDAQLHLHPEWHRATLHNGRWRLDPSKGTVDSLFDEVGETTDYISQRKAALEEIIATGKPGHRVTAYRAGAFSAQPGGKLIAALSANEFKVDSSVVHGLTYRDDNVSLDYRHAPVGRSMWRIQTDVAVEESSGSLWEVPIASLPGRRIHQLTFGRLKAKFSRNVPREQQGRFIKQLAGRKTPLAALKFFWQPVPLKFDFHNVAPDKLLHWIRKMPTPPNGMLDVVVLIGHSKEHIDDTGFDRLLNGLERDSSLSVVSFNEIGKTLSQLNESAAGSPVQFGASPNLSAAISIDQSVR